MAPDLWAVVEDLKNLADFETDDVPERGSVETDALPTPSVGDVAAPHAPSRQLEAQDAIAAAQALPQHGYRRRSIVAAITLPLLFGSGLLLLTGTDEQIPRSDVGTVQQTRATRGGVGAASISTPTRSAARSTRTPAFEGTTRTRQAFAWVAVPDAAIYRVRFFRAGHEVFEATATAARVVLPARWRFAGRVHRLEAGTYHWLVQPGFGSRRRRRYGKAVVAADWVAPTR